jgi:hypothetical protein
MTTTHLHTRRPGVLHHLEQCRQQLLVLLLLQVGAQVCARLPDGVDGGPPHARVLVKHEANHHLRHRAQLSRHTPRSFFQHRKR